MLQDSCRLRGEKGGKDREDETDAEGRIARQENIVLVSVTVVVTDSTNQRHNFSPDYKVGCWEKLSPQR